MPGESMRLSTSNQQSGSPNDDKLIDLARFYVTPLLCKFFFRANLIWACRKFGFGRQWIQPLDDFHLFREARRAEPMREFHVHLCMQVSVDVVPILLIIADLLAV